MSSNVGVAAPASLNPNQTSELHQDSLFGQSVHPAPPGSNVRGSSGATLHKGGSKYHNASMASTFQASSSHQVSFRSPYYGQDYHTQRPALKQGRHFKRMSQITSKNGEPHHLNDHISPYSILRTSTDRDVDGTIEKITVGSGARTNRAQLLR